MDDWSVPYRTTIRMPEPGVAREQFRGVMRMFPSAVSVVTALDARAVPRGLTCSAVTSLSMDPPTMLVCVNQANGSLSAIRGSGGFVVNLLRAGSEAVSDVFASASADKFGALAWRPSPGSGLPWLAEDALAFVDCRLIADVAAGSHAILVGLVTHGDLTSATEDGPMVYWGQQYGCWHANHLGPDVAT
ncbi:flavin reductase [Actinomadura sp. NPDC000600]|uniref:flavin reductase family protein n=1 Tax=Actinomadura sp. NPDC000600 TaxID=3154262 RepID=UPI0033999EFA